MTDIKVTKNYVEGVVNLAAAYTTHGQEVKAPKRYWFHNEHSPVRLFRYLVELRGVKTFISVHLVRHGVFASHFVTSNRDDLHAEAVINADRNTPVNHLIETNAAELISISRKRLCFKSHRGTVAIWSRVCKAVRREEPELYPFLVPECVYRNGICPEAVECKPGLSKVLGAYKHYPLATQNKTP